MCIFHSFMFDAVSGRAYEAVGQEHHSGIASALSMSQDGLALPEFHVAPRAVVFDGAPTLKALIETMKKNDTTSSRKTGSANGSQFLNEAWGRTRSRESGGVWNPAAIAKLQKFLDERFGTAQRLIEFVEPQWGIASKHCVPLLSSDAQRSVSNMMATTIDIVRAALRKEAKGIQIVTFEGLVQGLSNGANIISASDVKISDNAGNEIPEKPKLIEGTAGGRLKFEVILTAELREWLNGLAVDELTAEAKVHYQGQVDYGGWSKLFAKPENRVDVWKADGVLLDV